MKIFILKGIPLQRKIRCIFFLSFIVLFISCSAITSEKQTKKLVLSEKNYREKGIASWYGKKFHGRLTANGEVYNMYGISAAHKTLPLGTVCKVTNLRNGLSIVLRINDRGPFVGERIIDLSYGAAKKLGYSDEGLTEVLIEADIVKNKWGNDYSIQAGSFLERENAVILKNSLSAEYNNAYIEKYKNDGKNYFRVKIGHYKSTDDAKGVLKKLNASGVSAFIVSNK